MRTMFDRRAGSLIRLSCPAYPIRSLGRDGGATETAAVERGPDRGFLRLAQRQHGPPHRTTRLTEQFDLEDGAGVIAAITSCPNPPTPAVMLGAGLVNRGLELGLEGMRVGGKRQLIIWTPENLHSLDPETGEEYWHQPFKIQAGEVGDNQIGAGGTAESL